MIGIMRSASFSRRNRRAPTDPTKGSDAAAKPSLAGKVRQTAAPVMHCTEHFPGSACVCTLSTFGALVARDHAQPTDTMCQHATPLSLPTLSFALSLLSLSADCAHGIIQPAQQGKPLQ